MPERPHPCPRIGHAAAFVLIPAKQVARLALRLDMEAGCASAPTR